MGELAIYLSFVESFANFNIAIKAMLNFFSKGCKLALLRGRGLGMGARLLLEGDSVLVR